VELAGVVKSFASDRRALDGVDLRLEAGEIHALLGENGAGKSTLMNVLIGLVRPDAGRLRVGAREVDLAGYGPRQARTLGIAMVHQHSTLVPAMTVVENLAFGEEGAGRWFHPARSRERARVLGARFGLAVPLGSRVEDLSVGERQRAEILRALDRGARVLVLDEPTASLTPQETHALFPILRRLRGEGCALVFISHKLEEIQEIADRVTVLRRGRAVATVVAAGVRSEELGRMMLGRELPRLAQPSAAAPSGPSSRRESLEPLLVLRGVEAPGLREGSRLRGIDLVVGAGEIVGIAGIDGNGQRELEEVLAGVRPRTAGSIGVGGRPVAPGVRALRAAGVAQLSGDRERAGLVRGFSIAENLVLKGSYDDRRFFRWGRIDRAAVRCRARELIVRFGISPPDADADIATLSGGNAQKVAVARELDARPRVLVAVNPTRGLDVASARFVHEQLLALRAAGGGVLLVSTELDEVLLLSDRVLALVEGRLLGVPAGADRATLGALLLGRAAA
jgi:general nucleoside transport system ATP-binding protein